LDRRHLAEVDPLQSREIGCSVAVRAKFESSSVRFRKSPCFVLFRRPGLPSEPLAAQIEGGIQPGSRPKEEPVDVKRRNRRGRRSDGALDALRDTRPDAHPHRTSQGSDVPALADPESLNRQNAGRGRRARDLGYGGARQIALLKGREASLSRARARCRPRYTSSAASNQATPTLLSLFWRFGVLAVSPEAQRRDGLVTESG
jgi:hypothetical protein